MHTHIYIYEYIHVYLYRSSIYIYIIYIYVLIYKYHPPLELQNVVRFEDASCENTQSSAARHCLTQLCLIYDASRRGESAVIIFIITLISNQGQLLRVVDRFYSPFTSFHNFWHFDCVSGVYEHLSFHSSIFL